MKEGDVVADFSARDQTGRELRLEALLQHGPLALFFYPKAMTPG